MYFDFEDYRPDISPVGSAISWREGVLISIILHLVAAILLIVSPRLVPDSLRSQLTEEQLAEQRTQDEPRFVFVQPKVDLPAPKPPPRPELSDQDRRAQAPERAPDPTNMLPMSRGNSPERVEQPEQVPAEQPGEQAQAAAPEAEQQAAAQPPPTSLPETDRGLRLPPRISGGSLRDSLRNLQQYVEAEQLENPQGGGGQFGPAIQFDTMGVEFGPWIRRFIAQVKRNWEPLIPLAVWSMKGHVVITFNVHKNGAITDLSVVQPADLAAFNTAAYGALASSNPTAPLPPEYPAPKAFFTVTFFYNESPQ